MKAIRTHGIGYFVDKARLNHNSFDEFVSNSDSYFHYSNQILFEITKSTTALCLLLLILDRSGSVVGLLIISLILLRYNQYPGFKDNAKIFEGVIDRYCGVPP
ncbi:MAG: hypothetical protein ABI462_08120 [Ignavibacteria bacterium]